MSSRYTDFPCTSCPQHLHSLPSYPYPCYWVLLQFIALYWHIITTQNLVYIRFTRCCTFYVFGRLCKQISRRQFCEIERDFYSDMICKWGDIAFSIKQRHALNWGECSMVLKITSCKGVTLRDELLRKQVHELTPFIFWLVGGNWTQWSASEIVR